MSKNNNTQQVNKAKQDFASYICISATMRAALATRGCRVYNSGNNKALKQYLHNYLNGLAEIYKNSVSEEQHIKNIESLIKDVEQQYKDVLFEGTFRFGVVQKLVNLYLKHLWVAGIIAEPPHCPIDGIISSKKNANLDYKWTESNSKDEYLAAIKNLKDYLLDKNIATSLAIGELLMFNNNILE